MVHQHIGDARAADCEAGEVHPVSQSAAAWATKMSRAVSRPGPVMVLSPTTATLSRCVAGGDSAAVVPGQVLVVEHRERCVGGAVRLHP